MLHSRDEAAVDDVADDATPHVGGLPRSGHGADERVPHDLLAEHSGPVRVLVLEGREQLVERRELGRGVESRTSP